MEKLVWTSARVNHSRHMAGPAVATPWGHPRAHGERGLSPRLEAAEPAAGCPALNRIIRERMENGLGVGEVWLSKATDDIGGTVWALGPRISPSNSQVTFRSVSDDFESLKVWFIPAACRAGSLIQADQDSLHRATFSTDWSRSGVWRNHRTLQQRGHRESGAALFPRTVWILASK